MDNVERAQRESGMGISEIVSLRKMVGRDGNLLDEIVPELTVTLNGEPVRVLDIQDPPIHPDNVLMDEEEYERRTRLLNGS